MNYPKWWTDTVTVYNKYIDTDRIPQYKRSVVTGCFFTTASSVSDKKGKIVTSNGYTVRIKKDDNYINHTKWSSDLEDKYTINNGDIIILGIVEEDIDENKTGYTANDFLSRYSSESFTVKTFKENFKIDLPHVWLSGE